MTKYSGNIGFAVASETSPGVTTENVLMRHYRGDLLENSRKLVSSDQLNDDLTITNRISIVADPYAKQNFHAIRCAEFMGTKWKVITVSVEFPRIVLTLGGVYNGNAT